MLSITWNRCVRKAPQVSKGAHVRRRGDFGKGVTLRAGLRLDGMCAPFVVESGVTTAVFETYVARVLVPPRRGDIVIKGVSIPK